MRNATTMSGSGRGIILVRLAICALLVANLVLGAAPAAATPQEVDAAIKQILGGERAPKAGRIKVKVQLVVEDGSSVPITVSVDSPMTAKDYVKTIYLFADRNPRPELGVFHFTPRNGKAWVSIRTRLARSQNIVAVAEMSDGTAYMAKAEVKVTIGGCGS